MLIVRATTLAEGVIRSGDVAAYNAAANLIERSLAADGKRQADERPALMQMSCCASRAPVREDHRRRGRQLPRLRSLPRLIVQSVRRGAPNPGASSNCNPFEHQRL